MKIVDVLLNDFAKSPIFFLLIGFIFILVFSFTPILHKVFVIQKGKPLLSVYIIVLVSLGLSLYSSLQTIKSLTSSNISVDSLFKPVDLNLAWGFSVLVLVITLILLIPTYDFFYKGQKISTYKVDMEFYALVLLGLVCVLGLLLHTTNFMSLFVLIEGLSLVSYVLAAFGKNKATPIEGATKYFIIGSFASALLVLGVVFIYYALGTFDFEAISKLVLFNVQWDREVHLFFEFGTFFILISLLIKLGIAPFHMWVVDVYSASFNWIVSFFSLVPKVAFFYLFYHLYKNVFLLDSEYFFYFLDFSLYFKIFILLTWAVGALGALAQKKFWTLIAYSSTVSLGYVLASILFCDKVTFFLYIVIYSVTLTGLLLFMLTLEHNLAYKNGWKPTIQDISIALQNERLKSALFTFFLFSIAGMPPLPDFYTKFLIFCDIIIHSNNLGFAFFGILLSTFIILYYLRVILSMHFYVFSKFVFKPEKNAFFLGWYLVWCLFILLVVITFNFSFLYNFCTIFLN